MEKITDYRLKDFLTLEDEELLNDYIQVLELLPPVNEVNDPVHEIFGKRKISHAKSLSFSEVITLRNLLNDGSIEAIIEAVSIVTKLPIESVWNFTIVPFYSILNGIVSQLIEIGNMEQNGLYSEDDDVVMIEAQANERMSKFGILNTIDSLASGDVLRWKEIEKLPYMVVFTKLMMEKTKSEIMQDVKAIQQRKNKY